MLSPNKFTVPIKGKETLPVASTVMSLADSSGTLKTSISSLSLALIVDTCGCGFAATLATVFMGGVITGATDNVLMFGFDISACGSSRDLLLHAARLKLLQTISVSASCLVRIFFIGSIPFS